MTNKFEVKNKNVMITGASSGIGRSFAYEFARRGAHLILVARSAQKLRELCDELMATYSIRAIVIVADLSEMGACERVYTEACLQDFTPLVLVNNAGFATYGCFDELLLDRQHAEIMLNCMAVVEMTHHALPTMIQHKHGAIINVSSTAAFQPDPYMAIYGATKAFVLSFSEALWAENLEKGVRVLALCPGATETAFFDVVNAEEASVGKRMSSDAVVQIALASLDANKSYVITGYANWLLGQIYRYLPRRIILLITKKILRPR